jgi:hypothetical protein
MPTDKSVQSEILNLLHRVKSLGTASRPVKPASPEDIREFEMGSGRKLPAELTEWVSVCNGAAVNPGGLYSLKDILSIYKSLYPSWLAKGLVPIASDGCGDYYVLDTNRVIPTSETHPVYFVDQSDYDKPAYVVASGLWRFLKFLLEREILDEALPPEVRMDATALNPEANWPFNKSHVLRMDPELVNYQGSVPLPWELET